MAGTLLGFAGGSGTGSSGSARPARSTRPTRRSCSTAGFRKASWRDSKRRSRAFGTRDRRAAPHREGGEGRLPVVLRNRPAVVPSRSSRGSCPSPVRTIDPTPLVAFFFPSSTGSSSGHRVRPPPPGDRPARTMAIRKEPLVADATASSPGRPSRPSHGDSPTASCSRPRERLGFGPPLRQDGDFRNILLFAVGIGVLHVFLGVGLGIYTPFAAGGRRGGFQGGRTRLLAAVAAAIAGAPGGAADRPLHRAGGIPAPCS